MSNQGQAARAQGVPAADCTDAGTNEAVYCYQIRAGSAVEMREKLIDWLNSASANALGSAATTLSSDSAAGLEALGYGGVSDDEPTGTVWFEEDPENPWDERFQ